MPIDSPEVRGEGGEADGHHVIVVLKVVYDGCDPGSSTVTVLWSSGGLYIQSWSA